MLCIVSVFMLGCVQYCYEPQEQTSERPAGEAPSDSAVPQSTGPQVTVLDTFNSLGVSPGSSTAPSFEIDKPAKLAVLTTYHYIEGGGPSPGTLSLKGSDGAVYGPWQAEGVEGQGGVANAFWQVKPNVALPVGSYEIVDSDPGTWSTNDQAGGVGFASVAVVYD
jgi:hypothetical protein